jgi:hypothetical protein
LGEEVNRGKIKAEDNEKGRKGRCIASKEKI